ncbi:MAG: glutathione-dependent formaldehyde dehydrogenase, partial [Acidobacteria bacterium]|nr:glutathione-dependent formaldehyde dehydrogenase [Acidobacteriota bacterium]
DAVGVDANRPHSGPAGKQADKLRKEFEDELKKIAPKQRPRDGNWEPGDGPSQVLQWAVETVAKAGKISIIGVYSLESKSFPIGKAMNKNLTLTMGNCNHRRYLPELVSLVRNGTLRPSEVLTKVEPMRSVIDAYKAFDQRQPGWVKVKLEPVNRSLAA